MKELSLKTVIQGKRQGEPLIIFQGWAMNSAAWETVKPALEAEFLVTWIDLPGHGINREVTAGSLDEVVDLILPVLVKNSHLLGWSLGGLVAQAVAQQATNIKSLTLVASTLRFSQAEHWPHAMSQDVLKNFSESLRADVETTIKRFISLQFMGVKNSKELQGALSDNILLKLPATDALNTGLQILSHADFRHAHNSISQHWIFAEKDRLIPKAVINDLKLIRPDAQITLLKNTGHAPFMTHPKEFLSRFFHFMDML
jgi:pimeloyl-[acyl-carrier protein] methyl ester esterase